MKQVSSKQAIRNAQVAKIKAELLPYCFICGCLTNGDAAHLLPKSMYPQYYIEPKNIVRMCRACHNQYDESRHFRAHMGHAIERCKEFATEFEIFQYFNK